MFARNLYNILAGMAELTRPAFVGMTDPHLGPVPQYHFLSVVYYTRRVRVGITATPINYRYSQEVWCDETCLYYVSIIRTQGRV